ncbi:expressed unknown protein [Seminavis robusta]|uniref:Uncharacterized protein n=1 Tax=Seminavis robusta TaxID=568900 RepID=A0A9N8HYD0_9STRA|nr:expressed unknown protein [Seminavis robusta]|eukprot:Sro2451_g328120.1 n/a (208) ;mRNA; f:10194-10817
MCMPTGTSPQPTLARKSNLMSSTSSLPSMDKDTKKSVQFWGKVTKRPARSYHHFDEEQMEFMWYSPEELQGMRQHLKKVLKDQSVLESTNDVYRGLEAFANGNRKTRYAAHVKPVLKMHRNNRQMGVDDDLGVPTFAARLNEEMTRQGIQRAAQDATDAFEIYQEDAASSKLLLDHKDVDVQQCFRQTTYGATATVRKAASCLARSA